MPTTLDVRHICFEGRLAVGTRHKAGHHACHPTVSLSTPLPSGELAHGFLGLGFQPGRAGCESLSARASLAADPRLPADAESLLDGGRPKGSGEAAGFAARGDQFALDRRHQVFSGLRRCSKPCARPCCPICAPAAGRSHLESPPVPPAKNFTVWPSCWPSEACWHAAPSWVRTVGARPSSWPARGCMRHPIASDDSQQVLRGGGQVRRVIGPLRRQIRWEVADLADTIDGGPWDIILWRNLAIYLNPEPGGNALERAGLGLGPRGLPDRGQGRAPPVGPGPGAGVPVYLSSPCPAKGATRAQGIRMSVGSKIGVAFALGLVMLAAVGGSAYLARNACWKRTAG